MVDLVSVYISYARHARQLLQFLDRANTYNLSPLNKLRSSGGIWVCVPLPYHR